ncbi:MAG: hypothetical protein KF752_14055 [Pirellulaceae bacterium]|nr:hypothetical protein [Pirellulaceae bacterium]
MQIVHRLMVVGATLVGALSLHAETPSEIYQRRIIPLLQSPQASSCAECHLHGVKLDDFLTSDPHASFASLRARGWIDIDNPSESKLLQFIAMKPENSSELMNSVRASELAAIGEWIRASVRDPDSLKTPIPQLNDLKLDELLIQHARKDVVLSRFVDVVWSQFERCANCHSPDRNARQVEKHGAQMNWIIPNSPDKTLDLLEQRKLIDFDQPRASLLLTKALGQADHGGGVKFSEGGHTDRQWQQFLTDYAAIKLGRYVDSSEIPAFSSLRTWRTGLHLRIKELPALPVGQYAIVSMHRLSPEGKAEDQAVAFGEGRVAKDGTSWSTTIMLLEPTAMPRLRAPIECKTLLPDGRYQLRWTVVEDVTQALERILALPSTASAEIDSLWKTGHSAAKTLLFNSFSKY